MKIVFASDSFKGSLSSERIVELLDDVVAHVFPDATTDGMLVADGGEGTMDTIVKELNGTYRKIIVKNPLLENTNAAYGILPNEQAVIEMAQASGLPLLPIEKRNPALTSSYGTGMLINDALEQGKKDIIIALGGSATNDGGMGALSALGVKFYDKDGNLLIGKGEDLIKVNDIDLSGLNPLLKEAKFTVMCDVTNPLLGLQGATYTFGAQKGADKEMLDCLEKGMQNYAQVVAKALNVDVAQTKGAGAAGGLGFALLAFFNAQLKPGIETVLDLINFDERIQDADLVITGEGRMDWQSSFGKVPSGVGKRCLKANVKAVAIVGGLLKGYEEIYNQGICSIATTVNGIMKIDEAIENAEALYQDAAYRLLSAIKCGMDLK